MDARYDTRDAIELAAITQILSSLPADHPARIAYADHESTIALTRLVGRDDLVELLKEAFLEGYRRLLNQSSTFRP